MSAPAQVTEAHIARARASGFSTDKGLQMAAQFIANNEAAKAERDQLRAEVAWWKNWHEENEKLEDGIAVKVQATIDQLRAEVERLKNQRDNLLKPMRDAAIARAERAEAERNNLRADLDAVKSILAEEKDRADRAEAELDGIRALADRRNERDHSQDTTHQLVAALDQALDIAQAELATERARLDWLEKARPNAWALGSEECGEYWILTDTGEKHPEEAEEFATLRAAIDAAMKEGNK